MKTKMVSYLSLPARNQWDTSQMTKVFFCLKLSCLLYEMPLRINVPFHLYPNNKAPLTRMTLLMSQTDNHPLQHNKVLTRVLQWW